MPNHRLSAVYLRELDRQPAPRLAGPAQRMSRETPISISSESDSPIAVTITSASDSAQTISFDHNPDVALVSEIITVPEKDADQRPDTIEHVDPESDDRSLKLRSRQRARSAKSAELSRSLRRHDVRAARTRLLIPCVPIDPSDLRSRLKNLEPRRFPM